jgi:predicted RNase H-like HicB family nuclease
LRDNADFTSKVGSIMQLTAVLTPAEEGGFVALNPETGTSTQGETVEEAIQNLKEATALYLEEFPQASTGHPLVTMFSLPEPLHA